MERVLECPICTENFDRSKHLPLVLICGHTLCKHCTGNLQNNSKTIVCPFDKKEEYRKLNQISHSYHILELIQQVSSMSQTIKYLKLSPSERLGAMREQALENTETLSSYLAAIRLKISEINTEKLEIQSEISQYFRKIKNILEDREQVLLTEAESISKSYLKLFQNIEESVSSKLGEATVDLENLKQLESIDDEMRNIQPVANLPEMPQGMFKMKFESDAEDSQRYFKKLGKVTKQDWKVPHECIHFRNVTYWMVPPCCYKHYCCNKCHNETESHAWAYANSMICMFCSKEQDYRKLPNNCNECGASHTGVISK